MNDNSYITLQLTSEQFFNLFWLLIDLKDIIEVRYSDDAAGRIIHGEYEELLRIIGACYQAQPDEE